ncbi:protocadherin gamma-B1-like [Erythrolamprus reginae]|uniref:protocadherin gamma-B1-like n=1 Tax=Erythrolamprus reginae TaxID=121349 RepID=UPI00396CA95B
MEDIRALFKDILKEIQEWKEENRNDNTFFYIKIIVKLKEKKKGFQQLELNEQQRNGNRKVSSEGHPQKELIKGHNINEIVAFRNELENGLIEEGVGGHILDDLSTTLSTKKIKTRYDLMPQKWQNISFNPKRIWSDHKKLGKRNDLMWKRLMERRHRRNQRALSRQVLLLLIMSSIHHTIAEQIHYSIPEEMSKGYKVGNIAKELGLKEKELKYHKLHSRKDGLKYAELVLQKPLDRESEQSLHLILTALDGGEPRKTGTAHIWINVTDANDNPPIFTQDTYTVNLKESLPVGSLVLQVEASDKDEGTNAQITYHFTNLPPTAGKKFRLDSIKGTIYLTELLDFEETEEYTISFAAKDGGGLVTHCNIEIKISDDNDNIPEIQLASIFNPIPEDSDSGNLIALINVKDRDIGDNGKVTCYLQSDLPFKILPSSKNYYKLMTDRPLDREKASRYNITITATDKGTPPLSSNKTILLQISDINDNAPAFEKASYSIYVPENNPSGASIFQIQAFDQDVEQNSQVTYSILASNIEELPISSYISIHSETGIIYAQRSFDYEQFREFQLQVKAHDGGSPSLSSNVTVKVFILDRNDNSPQILSPSSDSKDSALFEMVPHSAEADYLVTKVVAVDADSGHNAWLSYQMIQATEPGLFTVGSHTGEIRTARAFLERDAMKHRLILLIKDNGQPPLSASVTLNLVFAENFQEALPEMKNQMKNSEDQSDLQFYLVVSLAVMSFLFLLSVILAIAIKFQHSGNPRFLQCLNPLPHSTPGIIFPPNFEDGTLPYSYQLCLPSESKKNEFTFPTPKIQAAGNILCGEQSNQLFTGTVEKNLISKTIDMIVFIILQKESPIFKSLDN